MIARVERLDHLLDDAKTDNLLLAKDKEKLIKQKNELADEAYHFKESF